MDHPWKETRGDHTNGLLAAFIRYNRAAFGDVIEEPSSKGAVGAVRHLVKFGAFRLLLGTSALLDVGVDRVVG